MGVKLAAASGGSIELVPTNTASTFTVTVPASTGTMATAESTLTQFNASGSAPVYACRAWVNFNGTGTVAIRASGNVSSITDNGTGWYTVNLTTAMPDTNGSVVCGDGGDDAGGAGASASSNRTINAYFVTASTINVGVGSSDSGTYRDDIVCALAIFR